MKRSVIGTVLITVLVLGALGAIGLGLYQVGYTNGLAESGAEVVVNNPVPAFHGWWGWGPGIGFGFFGIFFKIFFVILIIGLISRLFWGPRRWGPPGPYWDRGWHDEHRPPMEERMDEWHQKAHQEETSPPPGA